MNTNTLPFPNLAKHTVRELKQLCTSSNIPGRSKLKTKNQLIIALTHNSTHATSIVPANNNSSY